MNTGSTPPEKPAVAYCVGFIDKKTKTYTGCSIFSEENPTVKFDIFTFKIALARAETYEEAKKGLLLALQEWHRWAWETLSPGAGHG